MLKRLRVFACVLAAMGLLCSANCPAYAADGSGITGLISEFTHETKCNNVSVVVCDHGEISFYGDEQGLYQIGSMTKAFTGLAIDKLIIEGMISEDDPVAEYIPGFKVYYDSAEAEITIENLLSQRSGFTNNETDYPSASEGMSLGQWADSISGSELKSCPGTEYAYSNVNYNLLGLIIENVTEMSYKEYMQEEILGPFGLGNTYVGIPDNGQIIEGSRLGFRHTYSFPIAVREATIPAGYFYSNAEDMGRWIEIWIGNDADIPDELNAALNAVKCRLPEAGDYYGGWEKSDDGTIGHSGGTPNYSSRIVFDEEQKTGVCVLTNLNVAASTDSLCNGIYENMTKGSSQVLRKDVWTVFDIVFSVVTLLCISVIIMVCLIHKKGVLIALGTLLTCLLVPVLILFPIIFGAGLDAILFTWAPLSLLGGLVAMSVAIAVTGIRLWTEIRYANSDKTGGGTTTDCHN